MKHVFAAAVLAIGLSGCAQVGRQVSWDGGNAANMATAWEKIDPSAAGRVPCYQAFQTLGNGLSSTQPPANGNVPPIEIMSTVESAIELQSALQIPACQAIAAQVVYWLAHKAPIGGNLLP